MPKCTAKPNENVFLYNQRIGDTELNILFATGERAIVNDMSFSLGFYSVFRVCSVDATYVERETHTRTHAAKLKNKKSTHHSRPFPKINNEREM